MQRRTIRPKLDVYEKHPDTISYIPQTLIYFLRFWSVFLDLKVEGNFSVLWVVVTKKKDTVVNVPRLILDSEKIPCVWEII